MLLTYVLILIGEQETNDTTHATVTAFVISSLFRFYLYFYAQFNKVSLQQRE